jgi:hypothetical protein
VRLFYVEFIAGFDAEDEWFEGEDRTVVWAKDEQDAIHVANDSWGALTGEHEAEMYHVGELHLRELRVPPEATS